MTCKNCGTEIADKALICYRCGAATTEARRQPAAIGPPRRGALGWLTPVLVLMALAIGAYWLAQGGAGAQVRPEVAYTVAAVAALVLVLRVWLRRRRR
jgi:uncharacterized membrane protein